LFCFPLFTHCIDHAEDDRKLVEGNWACGHCEKGWYFDKLDWDCTGECTEYDDSCIECNDETCLKCGYGNMISKDKKSCVPKFDHCLDSSLSGTSSWVCDTCEEGYFWNG